MRTVLIAILAAGGIGLFSAAASVAAPASHAGVSAAAAKTSPVTEARLYCYRHYTRTSHRRFLHWGRCRGWE